MGKKTKSIWSGIFFSFGQVKRSVFGLRENIKPIDLERGEEQRRYSLAIVVFFVALRIIFLLWVGEHALY